MASTSAWRNISRIGGRILGTVGGTLLGQPQIGYQVGSALGDIAAGDPATRMKSFANYSSPNPALSYAQNDFTMEQRIEREVELPDPLGKVLPVVDTAINATGILNNIKSPFGDKQKVDSLTPKAEEFEQDVIEEDVVGNLDALSASFDNQKADNRMKSKRNPFSLEESLPQSLNTTNFWRNRVNFPGQV